MNKKINHKYKPIEITDKYLKLLFETQVQEHFLINKEYIIFATVFNYVQT